MRIFVLRHEARSEEDPSFWSPLTTQGMRNSMFNVAPILQKDIQPSHIYTSPLLRCVQTVAPFCAINKKENTLKCEPSLFERVRGTLNTGETKTFCQDTFRNQNVLHMSVYSHLHPYIDKEYVPFAPSSVVGWGETETDVMKRASAFLQHVRSIHGDDPDACILLVTHRSVVNALFGRDDDAEFPMGHVEELLGV